MRFSTPGKLMLPGKLMSQVKSLVKGLEEKLESSERIKFKLGQERDNLMAERDSLREKLFHQKNESDVKIESLHHRTIG